MTAAIRAWAAALVLAFAFLGAAPALAAPTFPPLTGRVVDDAQVLPPQVQADLTAKLAALEQKNGDQVVVATLPSLQGYPIEDYSNQLFRAWALGQKHQNNGVLFVIVPSERQIRIEVGYGLEPVLTDALSSVILREAVLPKFKAGDIPGGITAGTDAIIQQLGLDPADAQSRVQAAAQQAQTEPVDGRGQAVPVFLILIAIFLIVRFLTGGRGGGFWALPFLFMGGGGYGDRDDGFGGGGGFSGGGGSSGGGGASGSW